MVYGIELLAIPEMPLSEQSGRITRFSEQFGKHDFGGLQSVVPVALRIGKHNARDACSLLIAAGHETSASRAADWTTGMKVREPHPRSRQTIQVWGF